MKPKLIARAKPNDHRVRVRKKVFVYGRIMKRSLTDDQCYAQLMKQVAKVTINRVNQIINENKDDWRSLEKWKSYVSTTGSVTIGISTSSTGV
jgi:hypothetical protein